MATREELHKLIDSMPEEGIEAAHRMLSNLQIWPPPPARMMQMTETRTAAGTKAGFSRWDGDTCGNASFYAWA